MMDLTDLMDQMDLKLRDLVLPMELKQQQVALRPLDQDLDLEVVLEVVLDLLLDRQVRLFRGPF